MLEFLNYSLGNVYAFTLVLIRISGICVVAPFFGGEQVAKRIRALLALIITFVVFPTISFPQLEVPSSVPIILFVTLKELLLGFFIGFIPTAIFYGFQMGGKFASIHIGLAMARMLDPFAENESSIIGQIINMMLFVVFIVINGHHLVLKMLIDSFTIIPPTQFVFSVEIVDEAVKVFNIVIGTSLRVAAPLMAALFAINLVFGFTSKLVPQMNVFILSLPAKIAVGLLLLMVSLPAIVLLFRGVTETVFSDVYRLMHAF